MGQAIRGVSGSSPLNRRPGAPEAPSVPSIGRYLARQRELRGMDLDELVALTRIPRRSLERLENGAFDGTSDGFVRGFVRTVALAIGLDPDETVARMLVEPEIGAPRRWPRAGALIGIAVVAGVLAVTGAVVVGLSGASTSTVEPVARDGVETRLLRRDPVRALAEEQRLAR